MAVNVTIAKFRAQFPEFAATDDAHVQLALNEAVLLHNVRELATLYAAAHVLTYKLLAISGGGSSGGGSTIVTGQVSSKRVGPLAVDYTTHSSTSSTSSTTRSSAEDIAYFSGTIYGQHFLALEKRSARASIGACVV